ncbi:hypothetical protein O6H91_Y023000 [Diphasiastrum complanatum]|nr:hypothetical protein O6H91_Y023000 [Diphasiastrum complanatum]
MKDKPSTGCVARHCGHHIATPTGISKADLGARGALLSLDSSTSDPSSSSLMASDITNFRLTSFDDADNYVSQFKSIANVNIEGTNVDKLQIFPGLLRKQARIWYNVFLNQFREIGYKSRILGRLNNVQKKSKESLRKYTRKDDTKVVEDKSSTSKAEKLWKSNMADLNKKINDLKVQISEVADKRPKASSSNSRMWCMKCGTSGHTKEDCTTVNVKYIEDPAQEVLFIFQNDATTNYVQGTAASTQQDKPKFAPRRHNPPEFVGPAKSQTATKPVLDNCYNCGEPGHFSPDCPQPRKPIGYVPLCLNCRESGHKYPDCPQPQKSQPKYQYVATPAAADTKVKAATNAVVQKIDVIEGKLAKTEDQSWPSDTEKLFKVTTKSKSSLKPYQKSLTKHRKSSKNKSSSKTTNKSMT